MVSIKVKTAIMICLCGVILSGCRKENVDYQNSNMYTVQTDTDADGIEAEEIGGDIRSQLGIEDDKNWNETIHYTYSKPGDLEYIEYDIEMNVNINIPDTSNMYTMSAKKWYLTEEDKKKIMTYFVDESSIKYDTMREHTKEVYQSQIDYITGIIEDESGYISNISDNEEEIAIYKQSLNDCIAYLEQKKSEAPSEEELYNKAVSYDGYGYEGKKDGVKFYFEFYNDEERNRSAFLVTRNLYDEEGNYIFPKDKIELNEENIEASAVKICEDLGLSGMEVYGIRSEASIDSDLGEQTYYTVKLGRRINDVPVDISTYCYESNEIGNTDDFRVRIYDKSYSREEVVMVFDDYGVKSIYAYGLAKDCRVESTVKLLGFEQVKEVIREELSERYVKNNPKKWKVIELIYLRIENKDNEDELRYIPVWRLCSESVPFEDKAYAGEYIVWTDMTLFVNAMDGSIIDLDEAGAGSQYKMSNRCEDYE